MNGPDPRDIETILERALAEDMGTGDLTTGAIVPLGSTATANLVARAAGVVAGLPCAEAVFRRLDPGASFQPLVSEGDKVRPGTILARIEGNAAAILSGERTALNLVSHLSGIATAAAAAIQAVAGTSCRILDTRKTIPGLRRLEKYAVRTGGATNHRGGLDSGILIKDNHLRFCSIKQALERVRKAARPGMPVEVEVDDLEQLEEAINAGADRVLLDNMDDETIRRAVDKVREAAGIAPGSTNTDNDSGETGVSHRILLELSGGVNLERLPALARLGVDFISMGSLTHSAPALDIALDIEEVHLPE